MTARRGDEGRSQASARQVQAGQATFRARLVARSAARSKPVVQVKARLPQVGPGPTRNKARFSQLA